MFDAITQSCRYLLNNFSGAQEVREYLDSRLSKDSQEIFQFGFFPQLEDLRTLTDLVGEDALGEARLFYSRHVEDAMSPRNVRVSFFQNYPLILPYRNAYGEIIALVGRTLLSEEDQNARDVRKYKNTFFKKGNVVFGLHENKKAILEEDCVYVVEGQFDVIKAVESGLRNIVALGTASMSPYQFSVISRYTTNIVLLLDNDEAGKKGRKRALDNFGKLANIEDCYLPDGCKDIDEYFAKNDIGAWKAFRNN